MKPTSLLWGLVLILPVGALAAPGLEPHPDGFRLYFSPGDAVYFDATAENFGGHYTGRVVFVPNHGQQLIRAATAGAVRPTRITFSLAARDNTNDTRCELRLLWPYGNALRITPTSVMGVIARLRMLGNNRVVVEHIGKNPGIGFSAALKLAATERVISEGEIIALSLDGGAAGQRQDFVAEVSADHPADVAVDVWGIWGAGYAGGVTFAIPKVVAADSSVGPRIPNPQFPLRLPMHWYFNPEQITGDVFLPWVGQVSTRQAPPWLWNWIVSTILRDWFDGVYLYEKVTAQNLALQLSLNFAQQHPDEVALNYGDTVNWTPFVIYTDWNGSSGWIITPDSPLTEVSGVANTILEQGPEDDSYPGFAPFRSLFSRLPWIE
jgi:hypothetical protein